MEGLVMQRCVACRADAPKVTAEEISSLKPQIPDWDIIERDGVPQLVRMFKFPDFKTAMAFTQQVGEIAEEEGHHPAILSEWGKTTISWHTHAIKGLHRNDFIMAAKTDQIAKQFPF